MENNILSLIAVDQYIKLLVEKKLIDAKKFKKIRLKYIRNYGLCANRLEDNRIAVMALNAIALISYFLISRSSENNTSRSLILAGGLGNLLDRFSRGYVVDYIKLDGVGKLYFNLADFYIIFGVLAMVIENINKSRRV